MAIMAIYTANGFSTDDYDRVRDVIGWEADPPPGCVLHLLGQDAFGLCNLELWESEELFDAYVRDRFMPAFDKLGAPYPPAPRIMAVYNALQLRDAEAIVPFRETRAFA